MGDRKPPWSYDRSKSGSDVHDTRDNGEFGGVSRFGITEPLRKHSEALDFCKGVLDADTKTAEAVVVFFLFSGQFMMLRFLIGYLQEAIQNQNIDKNTLCNNDNQLINCLWRK